MATVNADRTLAAVLFTDMVDSTSVAEELGDHRWKALANRHHAVVRRELKRFGGRELDTAGDGFFASFPGPAAAIGCACAAAEAVRELGVEIRAGIHFGECERIGSKLGGITVVVGARVMALGGPGDVLISSTTAELTKGAGFQLQDRGSHRLKGVDDQWRVFAVTAIDGHLRTPPLEPAEAQSRRASIVGETVRPRRTTPVLLVLGVVALVVAGGAVVVASRQTPVVPAGNSLARIDTARREFAASYPISGAARPDSLAFGEGRLWLADVGNKTLDEIDPADGAIVRTIGTSSTPTGLAFEAGRVWVTYGFTSDPAGRLDELVPGSPGGPGLTRAPFEVPRGSSAIAAGSGIVWVADWLGATVTRYESETERTTVLALPEGADPIDLAWSGASRALWIAAGHEPEVFRVDASTATAARLRVGAVPPTAIGVAPDGSVWVVSQSDDAVTALFDSGVTRLQNHLGASCDGPSHVLATTDMIWVSCTDSYAVVGLDVTDASVTLTLPVGGVPGAMTQDDEGSVWVSIGNPK